MTDLEWIAPTIAAASAAVVGFINLARSGKTGRAVEEQGKVQAEQGVVQGQIHAASNSNMAAATAKIEEGNKALAQAVEKISALERSAVTAVADASTKAIAELRAELVARDEKRDNGGYERPQPRRRRR